MFKFKFRDEIVDCIEVDADPKLGFNFPFRILIPKNVSENTEVVYVCNLPRNASAICDTFDELIERASESTGSVDPMHMHLFLDHGYPLIIPAVPRTNEFRPNFLGRDCFLNDFSDFKDFKYKEDLYKYNNLPLQHKSIIEYAVKCLRENGINAQDKVIISGYSEGSKFASHFALLHPEVIKAVIAGGTSGTMSMPISERDGFEFKYPNGIADVPDFNMEEFSKIAFFYYMGKQDKCDPAVPYFDDVYYTDENGERQLLVDEGGNKTPMIDEFGNQVFKLDENGNYTSKTSLYSDEEVNVLNKVLGTVIQERFENQKKIYDEHELNSEFHFYDGNHRTVFSDRSLFKEVDEFIANNLNNTKKVIR